MPGINTSSRQLDHAAHGLASPAEPYECIACTHLEALRGEDMPIEGACALGREEGTAQAALSAISAVRCNA